MTADEFDTALTDLETRVDRLRALYENWFRGYEKSEPSVARKEVERRVYHLRKELPRNTALRFRYHQLYLRYTTLANYWQRSARQIEEGTHKLQLNRLRRRNDRRVERRKVEPGKEDEELPEAPPEYELDLEESLNVEDLLDELEMDEVARAIEHPSLPTQAKQAASAPGKLATPSTVETPMRPKATPAAAGTTLPKAPPVGTLPKTTAAQVAAELQSAKAGLPTTNGLPGSPAPANSQGLPKPSLPQPTTGLGKLPPVAPPKPGELPAFSAPTGTLAGAGRPAPMPAPLAGGAAQPGAAAKPPTPPLRPAIPMRSEPSSLEAPTGQVPLPPKAAPAPNRPAAPAAAMAKPAAPPVPAAASPAAPARPPLLAGPPQPKPPAAPPGVAARGAPAPASPAPAAANRVFGNPGSAVRAPIPGSSTIVGRPPISSPLAGAGSSGAPDEQRMMRIFDEYTAARRRNNEGDVRYEALVGSIQKMLPELTKKHQGKRIDFEVVVKDGRVGLKPKAT